MDFLIGGLAAMGATLFTNPYDVLTTRIQLQGELKAPGQHIIHYKYPHQAAYLIIKKEGLFALQRGLTGALVYHGLRNSIKLGSYQWLTNEGYIYDHHQRTVFYKSIIASACCGAAGAFFGTPILKATTQLQSQAAKDIAVGHQHKHSGLLHALRKIHSTSGVRGLWRGTNAVMVRSIVGASAQLSTFTKCKEVLRDYDFLQHSTLLTIVISSFIGSTFQTVFQTPFDVVCIRLNNQPVDAKGKGTFYDGMANCFSKIWHSEGFHGFYKGVAINYWKIVRQTTLYLVIWEILKDYQHVYLSKGKDSKC